MGADITLFHGDCLKVMATMPENTFDCVCTDPPYGLSFMGKGWDYEVPGPEYWRAVLRVCKPGAMLMAFGGTKTFHRLACAIEDADWEIRDMLMWLYSSGMPKCGDIGKLIDKSKGAERKVVGTKLGSPGYSLADNGQTNEVYGNLHNPQAECDITAPGTPEATKWTGFASALKPAFEPIILAMKPLDGTQAHNALTWGCCGMNIDASRIQYDNEDIDFTRVQDGNIFGSGAVYGNGGKQKETTPLYKPNGRWPSNVLLDEEAAVQLDAQTGILTSGTNCVRTKEGCFLEHGGLGKAGDVQVTYGDSGGASRFYYCSKASKRERGQGNNHPTVKPLDLMKYLLTLLSTPTGGLILDPFAGSGTTLIAAKQLGRSCVGIELDEHHCEIIKGRLDDNSSKH